MCFPHHAPSSLSAISVLHINSAPPNVLPVLLLHGGNCDSQEWMFQILILLSGGYTVVDPGLRGHGSSRLYVARIEAGAAVCRGYELKNLIPD